MVNYLVVTVLCGCMGLCSKWGEESTQRKRWLWHPYSCYMDQDAVPVHLASTLQRIQAPGGPRWFMHMASVAEQNLQQEELETTWRILSIFAATVAFVYGTVTAIVFRQLDVTGIGFVVAGAVTLNKFGCTIMKSSRLRRIIVGVFFICFSLRILTHCLTKLTPSIGKFWAILILGEIVLVLGIMAALHQAAKMYKKEDAADSAAASNASHWQQYKSHGLAFVALSSLIGVATMTASHLNGTHCALSQWGNSLPGSVEGCEHLGVNTLSFVQHTTEAGFPLPAAMLGTHALHIMTVLLSVQARADSWVMLILYTLVCNIHIHAICKDHFTQLNYISLSNSYLLTLLLTEYSITHDQELITQLRKDHPVGNEDADATDTFEVYTDHPVLRQLRDRLSAS